MTQLMDRIIHIRFDGRSMELSASELKLTANQASDEQIRQAVARHLGLPRNYFDGYVVVHGSTAIIVRPEAIYG